MDLVKLMIFGVRDMQSIGWWTVAALVLGVPASTSATVPPSAPARFDDIATDVTAQCAKGAFSGTVLVAQRGKTLLRLSCQPPGAPAIARDTRFKLFSMSKTFTGIAIGKLIDQGRIDPAAPVSRYVPILPAAWRDVTVQQLLIHTSGLPDLGERLYDEFKSGAPDHPTAVERLLAKVTPENPALSFDGKTKWRYNNFGYELLAHIGAKAAGKPFDQVLREQVLKPAGMRDTAIAQARFVAGKLDGSVPVGRLVQGYNGKVGALEIATSASFAQLGAGALIGTADDLLAFDAAMRAGRVISPAGQLRSRTNGFALSDTVSYGHGVMHRRKHGCEVLQHSGGSNGYTSDLARIPEREGVVIVLSNLGFSPVEAMRAKLVDRLIAAEPCPTPAAS